MTGPFSAEIMLRERSRKSRSSASVAAAGVVVSVAAVATAALFAVRWRKKGFAVGIGSKNGASGHVEDGRLEEALADLCRRFFRVCQNLANIAKTVRGKIEAGKVDITEEKLRMQLQAQCKVFESLKTIQGEVEVAYKCTIAEIQAMQQRASKDSVVQAYTDGFKTMLDDALSGKLPKMPNTKIPKSLDEEAVLKIQGLAQDLQVKKLMERAESRKFSLEDIHEVLKTAYTQAWDETLCGHVALKDEKYKFDVYHTAKATYLEQSDFTKEKEKMEAAHQQRLAKICQPLAVAAAKRR